MSIIAEFHQQFGFTRIELIAVVVVLGIVCAVALGKFRNLSDRTRLPATAGWPAG